MDPQNDLQAKQRFERLQQLLLQEDRAVSSKIEDEVRNLREQLVAPAEIEARVAPFIEDKVKYLQDNFPELFGHVLSATIKRQIEESQDEMVEALYPIIGKLIKRFVSKEIERLTEQIDYQVSRTFSWNAWIERFKGWFKGESEKDRIIQDLVRVKVEEVYLIARDSGLLMGMWSRSGLADRDMVAGMLTAIKAFVEDAFTAGAQELETIEYDVYKIIIRSFHSYYIAVVASGAVTSEFKSQLTDTLLDFASDKGIRLGESIDEELVDVNSKILRIHLKAILNEDQ